MNNKIAKKEQIQKAFPDYVIANDGEELKCDGRIYDNNGDWIITSSAFSGAIVWAYPDNQDEAVDEDDEELQLVSFCDYEYLIEGEPGIDYLYATSE